MDKVVERQIWFGSSILGLNRSLHEDNATKTMLYRVLVEVLNMKRMGRLYTVRLAYKIMFVSSISLHNHDCTIVEILVLTRDETSHYTAKLGHRDEVCNATEAKRGTRLVKT